MTPRVNNTKHDHMVVGFDTTLLILQDINLIMVSKPNSRDIREWVIDFCNSYEDHSYDNITEYIDGIVPYTYFEILSLFNNMGLEITHAHVGTPIWEIMRMDIFYIWEERFREDYEEYMNGLEEQ